MAERTQQWGRRSLRIAKYNCAAGGLYIMQFVLKGGAVSSIRLWMVRCGSVGLAGLRKQKG